MAFAVTVLAPGNFVRDSAAALPRHQVLEAVGMALNSSVDFARALLSENGLAWAASLIAALVAGFLRGATSRRIHRNWFPYVVILVGAFTMQDRKRVVEGKGVSVRVNFGVRRTI